MQIRKQNDCTKNYLNQGTARLGQLGQAYTPSFVYHLMPDVASLLRVTLRMLLSTDLDISPCAIPPSLCAPRSPA